MYQQFAGFIKNEKFCGFEFVETIGEEEQKLFNQTFQTEIQELFETIEFSTPIRMDEIEEHLNRDKEKKIARIMNIRLPENDHLRFKHIIKLFDKYFGDCDNNDNANGNTNTNISVQIDPNSPSNKMLLWLSDSELFNSIITSESTNTEQELTDIIPREYLIVREEPANILSAFKMIVADIYWNTPYFNYECIGLIFKNIAFMEHYEQIYIMHCISKIIEPFFKSNNRFDDEFTRKSNKNLLSDSFDINILKQDEYLEQVNHIYDVIKIGFSKYVTESEKEELMTIMDNESIKYLMIYAMILQKIIISKYAYSYNYNGPAIIYEHFNKLSIYFIQVTIPFEKDVSANAISNWCFKNLILNNSLGLFELIIKQPFQYNERLEKIFFDYFKKLNLDSNIDILYVYFQCKSNSICKLILTRPDDIKFLEILSNYKYLDLINCDLCTKLCYHYLKERIVGVETIKYILNRIANEFAKYSDFAIIEYWFSSALYYSGNYDKILMFANLYELKLRLIIESALKFESDSDLNSEFEQSMEKTSKMCVDFYNKYFDKYKSYLSDKPSNFNQNYSETIVEWFEYKLSDLTDKQVTRSV